MNINVDHQPNCRVKLHVEVPAATVKKRRGDILNYFSSIAKIPGYRPGKIPAHVVSQRYRAEVDSELENQLINEGCREAISRESLEVIQVVSVEDRKFHPDHTFTFTAEVETAPKFELPNLTKIPVKLERVVVTDEDVEHEIFHMREQHQKFEDKDGAAELGDVAVMKYVVRMDGQPLADTHSDLPHYFTAVEENWFMLDAEEDFVPGFYAALTGMAKGDKKVFSAALPADFQVEALREKTVEFDAECLGVKSKKLPELDADFLGKFGRDLTPEDFRHEVANHLTQRREEARDISHSNQVLAYLHDRVEFELPQQAVQREAQRRTNDMAVRAARSGMSNEDIHSKQDEIIGSATQQARQSVKVSFILEEVAKKEGIDVTQPQLQHAMSVMADRSGLPLKKFMAEAKKNNLANRLVDDLRLQNALAFLKDNADIEEVDPEPSKHGCAFEEGKA